ncbi:phosphoglycerate mutase [Aerococcus urinaehominis]|uniref:Phosphoglycerate mutase n=1 Tax=Aerococcus urinaehominis TaxID=128944 RepID=A0A109RGF7_9LACT|nr:histidine phosphatase family protein [Aerococcus urinaehominis]AMB98783.1 phosphoglycerate mutase [Aerococcus urinaehominis]SDM12800.1 probable phosphoglycerate mutase [Aerococcus urinaehominis]
MASKGVTIYFMRHGETYLNHYHRMQGWADAPLTEKGKRDAIRSGRGLSDVRFDSVYTSDLQRTVATAELILQENHASDPDLPIIKKEAFRELFFGSFEGLEAGPIWAEVAKRVHGDNADGIFAASNQLKDGGSIVKKEMDIMKELDPTHDAENFKEFWLRVELGLIDVITKHRETDQNILIVSHGMTIRNMINELVPEFEIDSMLDNASVSIVRYQDGLYHLEAYNQTDHFAIEEASRRVEEE